ncbi:MAG TPA: hypothetical protein VM661_17055 [Candidatus Sulfotelmatobacter sp.]|jgi:hypothetical protein|nr:hypothetical protein [Candidatus Sulfotelmatobacter sp.]
MSLFIPLCKVDAAQRLVYGQIDETPDRAGEVFDYKSSKRHFMAWSKSVQKATDGKSFGNVRAMHGPVAVGKLEDIHFDDASRSIQLTARIVDDGEWRKVEQGVYTGFSPGGRYVKRWRDGSLTRYTAEPSEISIVDLPCIPSASFTMVKADGAEVQVPFNADGDADDDDDTDGDSDFASDAEAGGYSRERLAGLLGSLDWLDDSGDWQDEWALGDQPIPDDVRGWLESGVAVLAPYLIDGDDAQDGEADDTDGGAFAASARPRGLMKMQRDLNSLRNHLGRLSTERDRLLSRVEALEALPKSGGPVLKAVSKGEDIGYAGLSEQERLAKSIEDDQARSLALIKLAHQQPKVLRF